MAAPATAAFDPAVAPGLGQPLNAKDLDIARFVYNELPYFEDQPHLHSKHPEHIKALNDIIRHHSMGHVVRAHSAHRHAIIPDGTVRLDTAMGVHGFTWNRATEIKVLDVNKIHATFFKITENGLVPIEFAAGPSPIAKADISAEFVAQFATYIMDNGLDSLIALEIGNFAKLPTTMAEMEIQWDTEEPFTLNLPASVINVDVMELIPTSWNVKANNQESVPSGSDSNPRPGTYYAAVIRPVNTHKVFFSGRGPLVPENVTKTLVEMGLLINV
ncbi:hypothetical protein V8C40DRAFT_283138 [Trichoderma camerunense]